MVIKEFCWQDLWVVVLRWARIPLPSVVIRHAVGLL